MALNALYATPPIQNLSANLAARLAKLYTNVKIVKSRLIILSVIKFPLHYFSLNLYLAYTQSTRVLNWQTNISYIILKTGFIIFTRYFKI
jgi:hypothetical protein